MLPEDARDIRRRVAIDYCEHQQQHGRGSTPGDAWRWAKQILEPRVRWEPLLAGAVRRAAGWANGRTDYTYTRPSRRQSTSPRILLPGLRRPVPQVAVVVDTSGSVDDVLLGRALGEVDGALRGLGVTDSSVSVYSCDAAVHQVQRVRRAKDAKLAGGGGTDMRVGIRAASAQRPRPDLIVVFTDGDTPWPETPAARERGDRRAARPRPVTPAADAAVGDAGGVPGLAGSALQPVLGDGPVDEVRLDRLVHAVVAGVVAGVPVAVAADEDAGLELVGQRDRPLVRRGRVARRPDHDDRRGAGGLDVARAAPRTCTSMPPQPTRPQANTSPSVGEASRKSGR